ncbi:hypothetical protein JOQ06_010941 [Pogonophryne albipinna]|uniref:Uncharacterized protein n=1 Tax=Pogonophryne albipinna TaxID=1090488 RepID=A0AAD6AWV1_9TELE|nr:hypothetical protein JOQ06_010941 [Pogonophryne albipinna]
MFSNEFNNILIRCIHHLLSVTCAAIQKLRKGHTDRVVKDKGVHMVGSCEAGALRRGPKKECRDSMIHKAE